jgi:hypothetical protein
MIEAKIVIDYYGDVIASYIVKNNPHPSSVAIDLTAILIRYLDSHTFICRSNLYREFLGKRLAKYKEETKQDKENKNLQYVYRLTIRNGLIKLVLDWGYRDNKTLFLWKQDRRRVYIEQEQLNRARQERITKRESLKNIETLEKYVKPKRIRIR